APPSAPRLAADRSSLTLESMNAGLANGVVGWHFEQRGRRVAARHVDESITRVATAGILVVREHQHLQLRGRPLFGHDRDRAFVADRAGRDRDGRTPTVRNDAFDDL